MCLLVTLVTGLSDSANQRIGRENASGTYAGRISSRSGRSAEIAEPLTVIDVSEQPCTSMREYRRRDACTNGS